MTGLWPRNTRAEEVFTDAWRQVQAGSSVESVLAQHPDLAADLEPMLRLALEMRRLPAPALAPDALGRIQARALAAAASRRAAVVPSGDLPIPARTTGFLPIRLTWRGALLALAAILLAAGALLFALRPTQPPPPTLLTYTGVIQKISAADWQINGAQVWIDKRTVIHGQPAVGAQVECLAEVSQGGHYQFYAHEVWVRAGPGTPLPATPPK